jgi:hypothetical protein
VDRKYLSGYKKKLVEDLGAGIGFFTHHGCVTHFGLCSFTRHCEERSNLLYELRLFEFWKRLAIPLSL